MSVYQGNACKRGHSGLRYSHNGACVECTRMHASAQAKTDAAREYQRQYKAEYTKTEKRRQQQAAYRQTEGYREAQRRYASSPGRRQSTSMWGKRNRTKTAAAWAAYDAAKVKAQPAWLTADMRAAMQAMYAAARALGMQVDHIEPLRGRDRRGLHVPWNLQLLTPEANRRKGNS